MPSNNFEQITSGINLTPQASVAGASSNGDVYYNSSTNLFQFYQNGAFVNFLSGLVSLTAGVSGTLPIANGGTNATSAAAAFNNLNPMTTTGDLIYESATNVASRLAIGSSGQVLTVVGGVPAWSAASTGTVTSVALTVPGFLSVSGSPITTSGTLAVTLATETANTVFAGPTSGGATTPTFRALGLTDLPSIANNTVLGNTSGSTAAPSALTAIVISGSVTAGSFIPTGSTVPVNGMYLSTTNTVAFATNTTNAGTIDANGTWTIGVSGTTHQQVIYGSDGNTQAKSLVFNSGTGGDFTLAKNENTGSLTMTGASSNGTGAVIILYGNSNGSNPNITKFQNAGINTGNIDASGNWTLGNGSSNVHVLNTSTATSATAGTNGAVPAQVVGYVIININGSNRKIPYFAT